MRSSTRPSTRPSTRSSTPTPASSLLCLAAAALLAFGCDGTVSIEGGDEDASLDAAAQPDSRADDVSADADVAHDGDASDTGAPLDTSSPQDTSSMPDTSVPPDTMVVEPQPWGRVATGHVALYAFDEGGGTVVHDLLGSHDLHLDPGATVTWSDGALGVEASTRLMTSGAASGPIQAIRSSGALTLEAWLTPAATHQSGPARIAGLSLDPTQRDLTLGQADSAFVVRLRTTATDTNGLPQLDGPPSNAAQGATAHVVFTRDASSERLYVDGVEVASRAASGELSSWDDHALVLANEADGSRPWLGTFHLLAIYDRALTAAEVQTNFSVGPEGDPTDLGAEATPPPVTDPEPDPDPSCIGESLLTSWDVTDGDLQRQFVLPLEAGVTYDRITIELEFDPAVWGELCYNPVWSPPRLFEPFHYLVTLQRGAHWCKGGDVFGATLRGPGADRLLFETYHKDQPHTGSGCGSSLEHDIIAPQSVAPAPGQFHTVTIVYDPANATSSITIDGQTFTGTPLPAATLSATATTPLVLDLGFHDELECFDETGAHDTTSPCCHIPSPGWRYRNVSYEICR